MTTTKIKALCGVAAITLNIWCISYPVSAETRRECELNTRPNTGQQIGTGIGTVAGSLVAPIACSGLLAAAFVDFGLSTALCFTLVTLSGTVTGAALAEAASNDELRRCAKLPD